MNDEIFEKICNPTEFTPSLKLLELLLKNETLFKVTNLQSDEAYMAKNNLRIFYDGAPALFMMYLNEIQAMMPTPGCLEREIPEYAEIIAEEKYNLEYSTLADIVRKNNRVSKIIEKLKKIDSLADKCKPAKETIRRKSPRSKK